MPFCPKCGYEYEPTVSVCPDCDMDLVDELDTPGQAVEPPRDEADPKDNLKELFSTISPEEANLIQKMLENEGIFCSLENEVTSGVLTRMYGEISRVKVMVKARDLIKASKLVEAYYEDEEGLEQTGEFLACSKCGAGVESDAKVCPACGEIFDDEDMESEDE